MSTSSVVNRFMKYVTFDTQAVRDTGRVPSSKGQFALARYLTDELRGIGLKDAACDEHAYVIATLPANSEREIPTVALIAHLDTAFETNGRDVRPRIVRYEGGDVVLDEARDIRIPLADYPELAEFRGEELIVTDGSTLLGGDDKAGIAAIVDAVERLAQHPEVEHGTVKVVFTPDEEIGHLAAYLDLEKLGADFAYTVDAGDVGELSWETFNAATATVRTAGRAVHPGEAKGKMKNACVMLLGFIAQLPASERPETTEGREGYFHVVEMNGAVDAATATLFIRDHDRELFEKRKERLCEIAAGLNAEYGAGSCSVETEDVYYNLGDKLKDKMYIVEYAREAIRRAGIEPYDFPFRGGTDGATLTWRGLPTPNIFKGSLNCHGVQEYQPVRSLEKCAEVLVNVVRVIAESRGGEE